jgi:hypothetical protein
MGGHATSGAAQRGPGNRNRRSRTGSTGPDDKPKVTALIATGAKADAERARSPARQGDAVGGSVLLSRTNSAGNGVSAKA